MQFIKISFLILAAFVFISCGENTQTPVTSDVKAIKINETNITMHSTDTSIRLSANAIYDDNSEKNVTYKLTWSNSDYDVLRMYMGEIFPVANGGDANISISYGGLTDSVYVKVYKLNSLFISSPDINTTGTHLIEAKGDFIDPDTNATVESNVTIVQNIKWHATNGATVTITNNIAELNVINTGETNLTAVIFEGTDYDMNVTKTYNIN